MTNETESINETMAALDALRGTGCRFNIYCDADGIDVTMTMLGRIDTRRQAFDLPTLEAAIAAAVRFATEGDEA